MNSVGLNYYLDTSKLLDSATLSINDFTRKQPLTSIVATIALSILAFNIFAAGSITGLAVGSIFAFTAYTSMKHIFSHREEFATLIRYSFRALLTPNFNVRQGIEVRAEAVRNIIESQEAIIRNKIPLNNY